MAAARDTVRTVRAHAIVDAILSELASAAVPVKLYVIGWKGEIVLWPRGAPQLPPAARTALTRRQDEPSRLEIERSYVVAGAGGLSVVHVRPLRDDRFRCAVLVEDL